MTSKREEVEQAANALAHEGYDVNDLKACGFTICGPDEVPMPKELPHSYSVEARIMFNRQRDAYQRDRNGGETT